MPATPWGDADDLLARRLSPGPGLARAAVVADQRERLLAALAVLAAERGYGELRVEDLTARAGVSRAAFYEQFGGRAELLREAVDDVAAAALEPLERAASTDRTDGPARAAGGRATGSGRHGLAAADAIHALLAFAAAQPEAARLWLVEAPGAEPDAQAAGERGDARLAAAIAAAYRQTPSDGDGAVDLSPPLPAALSGGLRAVVARRLRDGRAAELADVAAPLAGWLAAYRPPPRPLRRPRPRAAPADGPRFTPRDPAERIILGLCEAVYEKGYAAATIGDIARLAGTSTRTFYAHYDTKQEAFVDAIDLAQVQSDAAARAAARRALDWPRSVRAGIEAICSYYATEPVLAEAVLIASHAAGDAARRRRDEAVETVARLLEGGLASATRSLLVEAISGAIDTLLADAVRAGGGARVRAIVPAAAYVALTPVTGPETAVAVANETSARGRRRG